MYDWLTEIGIPDSIKDFWIKRYSQMFEIHGFTEDVYTIYLTNNVTGIYSLSLAKGIKGNFEYYFNNQTYSEIEYLKIIKLQVFA